VRANLHTGKVGFGDLLGDLRSDDGACFEESLALGIVDVFAEDVAYEGFGVVLDYADYLAVGRFDEAELVDLGICGERADQTDVGTFRSFYGADGP